MHDLRNLACLILLSDPRNNARRFLLRPLIWLVKGLSFRVISVTFRLIEAGQNPFEVSFMGICPPAMTDYGLAHDLLNELMIVIAGCDLLAEEFLECGVSKHLHVIRETAVHMSQRIAAQQASGMRKVH